MHTQVRIAFKKHAPDLQLVIVTSATARHSESDMVQLRISHFMQEAIRSKLVNSIWTWRLLARSTAARTGSHDQPAEIEMSASCGI